MPSHCTGNLFKQEPDGHQFVPHAGAKHFGGLAEDARDLMQASDVILVVLDGIELEQKAASRPARYECRSSD